MFKQDTGLKRQRSVSCLVDETMLHGSIVANFVGSFQSSQRNRRSKKKTPELPHDRPTQRLGRFYYEKCRMDKDGNLHGITGREETLLGLLNTYFTDEIMRNWIIPLNDESTRVPALRTYNFALTNLFKEHPFSRKTARGDISIPYDCYDNTMRGFHKLNFDPFRRGTHLYYELDDRVHYTTVGQLNFLHWCQMSGIDEIIRKNEKQILLAQKKSEKQRNGRKRRRILSKMARSVVIGGYIGKKKRKT
jgi:hypothetical protein